MKDHILLHQQLLQQQLASQAEAQFDSLPSHIIVTLDNMAFGIAQKEGEPRDSFTIKQSLVSNINRLSEKDFNYLTEQLSILIDKSVHQNEQISDKNVEKDFVSFLVRLYY